jgi:hypothetical protein
MRNQILCSGFVAAAIALGTPPPLLGGQDAGTPKKEAARAADVLAATRKAIGRLDALKTLTVESDVQRNVNNMQLTSEIAMLLELPDKYTRVDTPTSGFGAGFTSGFNGDRPLMRTVNRMMTAGGGMVIRMGGPAGADPHSGEKPTPEQQADMDRMALRAARQEVSRMMLGWFGMTHPTLSAEYSYAGEAESPDGNAHVIDVRAEGFAARLFVDQQTHLPLMVTYQGPQPRMVRTTGSGGAEAARQVEEMRTQPPAMVEHALFFSDWRAVDGLMFPHQLSRATAGTPVEEWKVTKVKVNPKIDPKKFEVQN